VVFDKSEILAMANRDDLGSSLQQANSGRQLCVGGDFT